MMNIKGIFAVSLIAMVAVVAGAHTSNAVAAIASKGYVDEQVGSKLSSISGSTTGSGNVVTSVSASGSNVSANKGITAEETKNKVTSVRAVASATDTAYPSEKAVATALAGKANTSALSGYATTTALSAVEDKAEAAQSAASAAQTAAADAADAASAAQSTANAKVSTAQGTGAENKAVITNSTGNVTTGQIATGMIADDAVTSAKIADGTITNANIAAGAAIATSKISGLATVATSGSYDDLIDQPTIPTVNNGQLTINVNGTSHSFTANQAGGTTVDIDIPDEVDFSGLSGSTTGGGNVVTNVTQTNGKVSAFKGITAEVASNRVTSANFDSNTSNDTKYPTVKAVADALAGKADATDLDGKVDVFQGGTKANQAVITNGSGNIITGFITKSMLGEDVVIPDEYELPPATESALGGVKSGGDINVDTSGAVTVKSARSATNAKNAINDEEGNNIILTYATKSQITALDSTSTGTGAVVTGVSQSAGKVSVTKGNVKIPVGGENATSYATIWIE